MKTGFPKFFSYKIVLCRSKFNVKRTQICESCCKDIKEIK